MLEKTENPVLTLLKRNKAVFWIVAVLALAGGAIQFGGNAYDVIEKFVERLTRIDDDDRKRRNLNANAASLGFNVADLAVIRYLIEAAHEKQVDAKPLEDNQADARGTVGRLIEDLHLSHTFADLDYTMTPDGNPSWHAIELANAINNAKVPEAGRYFLFEYWATTILLEISIETQIDVPGGRWRNLVSHLNENLPQGAEPYRPVTFSPREYCEYFVLHSAWAPFSDGPGKRDRLAAATCNK